MRQLKICVLGGTGFVGRRLVARLAGMGHRIRVPTRSRARNRRMLVLPTVTLVTEDVHDPATLERAFEGMDAVINLIAILNERGNDGSGFRHVHTELAEKVIAACRARSVHRLLHVSALNADAEKGPSYYLKTKGEAENALRAQSGETLAWTIFQPSLIFGAEDSFTNRFARLLRFAPVLPLARPDSRFAPAYVENVAQAIAQAIEDRATHGQTYQLCGPRVYTLREIVEFLRKTLSLRRWVIGLPDAASRLQAKVMDFVPGKPFSTDNYLSLTVDSVCQENGFAHFGIEPHSLEGIVPQYLR